MLTFYFVLEILDIKSNEQNMNLYVLGFKIPIFGLQLLLTSLSSVSLSAKLQEFSLFFF